MSSFKKLNTKVYQKSGAVITPDTIYWKKFDVPVLVKEFGPIDYIDFSLVEPHCFAVTCSVRVQIYNPVTKLVTRNLSRFRESAYGAVFRADGKLLCAGGEDPHVKLFDVSSQSLLRLFKGHSGAVHRTYFVSNKPQIVSFSDDKSVKIWDIPTEKNVISYSDHADYIRSGSTSSTVPDIVLSGSYDNTVKMYDIRTDKLVFSVNHGRPVESVLFLPSGGVFLSAGGTEIKIWDILAGGRLLGSISQHNKTITCMHLASENKRLLSGSLDRHVKIYDISTFKVVHTLNFPNGVLSLGVSKNDDTVAAGLVDGLVSISRKKESDKMLKSEQKTVPYKYESYTHSRMVDNIVPERKKEVESKHDYCLRKFKYSKALDYVLLPYVVNKNPETTVSVIQELIRRRALHRSFKGRETKSISQILRFFLKYIADYRFTRILLDAINIFLDVYEDSIDIFPCEIKQMFVNLCKQITLEIELLDKLASLQGSMHLLLAGASSALHDTEKRNSCVLNLVPSTEAQKNFIVNLT